MNNWLDEISGFFEYLNTNEFAAWTLVLTVIIGFFLFVWTTREIANWFLRTRTIIDEQRRMNLEFKNLSHQINSLDKTLTEITSTLKESEDIEESSDVELEVSKDSKTKDGFEVTH